MSGGRDVVRLRRNETNLKNYLEKQESELRRNVW